MPYCVIQNAKRDTMVLGQFVGNRANPDIMTMDYFVASLSIYMGEIPRELNTSDLF